MWSSAVSHSHTSPHSASSSFSRWPFKCCYQFPAAATSALGEQVLAVSLWMHPSLQTKGMAICLATAMFSCPGKAIDFQFVHLFLIVRTDVSTSKFFTCWSWNKFSLGGIFIVILLILQVNLGRIANLDNIQSFRLWTCNVSWFLYICSHFCQQYFMFFST